MLITKKNNCFCIKIILHIFVETKQLKLNKMKKEFKPIYKLEELLVMDKEFLAKVICRQERDIHNLHEEIASIMKEWKSTINLINK